MSEDKRGISIVIPAYNEEASIGDILDKIKKVMEELNQDYEIIVVDDGSTDRTAEIVKEKKNVRLIQHPYNKGYGAALKKGIKEATKELILITDADGTYSPDDIPKILKYVDKYDMVIGARTEKDASVPILRRPAKWFLSMLANFLVREKIPDINSGLRVFRKDLALSFWHLFPSGFSFTTTLTLASLTDEYSVKFVPIGYYKRKGKSSIKPIRDFLGFTSLILRVAMYFKPLRFFLGPGLFMLIIGLGIGVYQIIVTRGIGDSSIVLIVSGLQICFIGLIADLIVRRGRYIEKEG